MKKSAYALVALLALVLFASCNNYETYGDLKKKERAAISQFIIDKSINVISEAQFNSQGQTTDVSKNEFAYLEKSGIYMQIVRKGCGNMLEESKTVNVICRFSEFNILTDSMQVRNDLNPRIYDTMSVRRTGSTFTASFLSGMMMSAYGSSSVPAGWLVPLLYINVGRPVNEGDEIAKVNLIVPHTQGQAYANSSVYPCYYTITYEREP
ncbi:MAG: DUF4827 domain-containing protein [Prevotella sp.]|nr:DUF4827 domain-containing protein [Prevotella sp.]